MDPETLARPQRCVACGRLFIVIGERPAESLRCVCTGMLSEASLPNGVYELHHAHGEPQAEKTQPTARAAAGTKRSQAALISAAAPSDRTATPSSHPIPREPDLGYGESHGYGPAHGGPSGPGDAPATNRPPEAAQQPKDEPSAKRS